MGDYGDYAALELHFGKDGHATDPADAVAAAQAFLAGPGKAATDIIVFSHGWNNTDQVARDELYTPFLNNVRDLVANGTTPYRGTPALIAIFWPSQQFVAPGAAGAAAAAEDPAAELIGRQLDALAATLDPSAKPALEAARAQIAALENSEDAQNAFVKAIGGLFAAAAGPEETDGPLASLGAADGTQVLASIQAGVAKLQSGLPAAPSAPGDDEIAAASIGDGGPDPGTAGADLGQAAGLLSSIGNSITAAGAQFLNLFTYYTMKERAGIVGATGVAPVVAAVSKAAKENGQALHLIGHSFGARLVTAAASAQTAAGAVTSLTLLQGAYSHYGLAKNWDGTGQDGAFRHVLGGNVVSKFVLVTHSLHDGPVGTWYPLASEIAGQVAAAAQAVSKWGGMGGDGAQDTPEFVDDVALLPADRAYPPLAAGKLRNVDGSGGDGVPTITGHGDVTKPEVVAAVLRHIA